MAASALLAVPCSPSPRPAQNEQRSGENIISWIASFLQRYNNIYNVAIFLVVFVKLASDFNLNIYHLASYWVVPEKNKQGRGDTLTKKFVRFYQELGCSKKKPNRGIEDILL